ncbi:hypothetical protein MKZ38_001688 [Zalerion maritima]|uniref:Uncharacterized protein n=1 Tax=Zalerion maritima TaxID=339359 RepID=A0AAD5RPV5_9PEZI|nr:hypothetical protein MKZ38_001688 [Zalerion maritima]
MSNPEHAGLHLSPPSGASTDGSNEDYAQSKDDDEYDAGATADSEDDYQDGLNEQDDDVGEECGSQAEGSDRRNQPSRTRLAADEEVTSLAQGIDVGPDPSMGALGSRKFKLASETGDIRELLSYPSDPRCVRYPDFDLKPMSRYSKLPHLYFGRKGAYPAQLMAKRWLDHYILPSKLIEGKSGCIMSPWPSKDLRPASIARLRTLHIRISPGSPSMARISQEEAEKYLPSLTNPLIAKLGYESDIETVPFQPGKSVLVDAAGIPLQEDQLDNAKPEGLMFDVGGVVLDMDWAPRDGNADQFLLLSVTSSKDELVWDGDEYDFATGCLQLWKISSRTSQEGIVELPFRPIFKKFICSDWGRIKRLKWCPVPLDADRVLGLAAILCGDGKVRVLEIRNEDQDEEAEYVKAVGHVAVFSIEQEQHIWPTCLTWINGNRLCIGHTDGSITLWSIRPSVLIQRLFAHHCQILDIASAYPSHPTVVCAIPISGSVSILDLNRPTSETTSIPVNATNFQPNLLDWSDHLQCFVAPSPTIASINTTLSLFHIRYFPTFRNTISLKSFPMTASIGTVHPFILAGDSSGTVWACSAMHRLLPKKSTRPKKMRVLTHEYRPPATIAVDGKDGVSAIVCDDSGDRRGSVRILTGFQPEPNVMPKTEALLELVENGANNLKIKPKSERRRQPAPTGNTKPRPKPQRKSASPGVPRTGTAPHQGTPFAEADAAEQESSIGIDADANPGPQTTSSKVAMETETVENGNLTSGTESSDNEFAEGLMNERLSRITKVQWNPNLTHGHWAAVAMGSGLVRIMDLGVEF